MSVAPFKKIGWRIAYQQLLAGFFEGATEDLLKNVVRKTTGIEKSKAVDSLGSTELKYLLGMKQVALGRVFYELIKSATTTKAVDYFHSFAPTPDWESPIPAGVGSIVIKKDPSNDPFQMTLEQERAIKQPINQSERWQDHVKITYAYFEATAKLQSQIYNQNIFNGWEFINLLCIQEAAIGDGIIDTERLYKRICAEFPELQPRIGYRPVMQFVIYRSSKDVVEQLAFLTVAVFASRMIYECVKDVRKPWPQIPEEGMA